MPDYGYFHSMLVQRGGYYPGIAGMSREDQFYLMDHGRAVEYWYRAGALALPWFTAMQNRVQRQQSLFLSALADGQFDNYADYIRAFENQ